MSYGLHNVGVGEGRIACNAKASTRGAMGMKTERYLAVILVTYSNRDMLLYDLI
jgi:hypothetical protein